MTTKQKRQNEFRKKSQESKTSKRENISEEEAERELKEEVKGQTLFTLILFLFQMGFYSTCFVGISRW